MRYSYNELLGWIRKGYRNSSWHRLSLLERGFLRAAILYAKIKGIIVNAKVAGILSTIIEKIRTTPSTRIIQAGLAKAEQISTQNSQVFKWCPRLREWLLDCTYIFWLGLTELSTNYSACRLC
ncbi:MAG: hypothetical protein QXH91_01670 [Candidatus Bathyarchaeia archaeon]